MTLEALGGLGLGTVQGGGDGDGAVVVPMLRGEVRLAPAIYQRVEIEVTGGVLTAIGYVGGGARVWLDKKRWVSANVAAGADLVGARQNTGPGGAARVGFVLSQREHSRVNLVLEAMVFRRVSVLVGIQTF